MKVVAFLPAKGKSERIASKNTALLGGKPLFLHTLEKLVSCDFIDEVYLDSESDDILNYAPYLNYIPLKRDPALASNKTDGHQIFYNEVKQVEADIYVQILCTSPFIEKETIRNGITALIEHEEYDSAILVKKEKQYCWDSNGPLYDINHIPNSVDLPDTTIETMGMYIVKSSSARTLKRRIGNNPFLIEASPLEAIDINYPEDFALAQYIASGICYSEKARFEFLAKHLSSSLFADVLWELNIDGVITGLTGNIPRKKVFGRASTLKLRALHENEDYHGIYEALKTYQGIRPGEIILVETECAEHAYFGELNSNLAIRSGAIATIIDGVTRDIDKVTELDYPVFYRGRSCADIRGIGTIDSFNQTIHIGGIPVSPGDLVFADGDGIAVVPTRYEELVLSKVFDAAETETSVLKRISKGEEGFSIYNKEGAF